MQSAPARTAPTASASLREALYIYRWPALVLALAVPLVLSALAASLAWFDAPFPGFFVMRNRVVPTVAGFAWPADRARVLHAQVVAVDGAAVDSSAAIYDAVAARPAGTPFRYTLRRGGATYDVTLPSMPFGIADYAQTCGVLLLFGCAWLAFAVVVGVLQPHTRQARVYLLLGLVAGLYPVLGIFLHRPDHPLLTALYFALECLFPATWVHLALVFPVERRFTGVRRAWPLVPYAISAALTAAVLRGFYREPPDLTPLYATYLYGALAVCFFVAVLAYSYHEQQEPRVRLRVKAVLPGAIVAGMLALFALVDSAVADRRLPVQFGLLLSPVFSAAVAYAIAKHDLFDVDRLIRQSFVYALLSLIVTSLYGVTLALSARLLPEGRGGALLGVVFVIGLAFALDPLRRLLQRLVDRAFYRGAVDHRATIRRLSEVLITLLDPHAVVGQVTRVLGDALSLESAAVCLLPREGTGGALWVRSADGQLRSEPDAAGLAALAEILAGAPDPDEAAAAVERAAADPTRAAGAALLARFDAGLVLPLRLQDRVIGLLVLGRKRAGTSFSADDVDLLRTLANQTAIAVHNAQSYQALADLTRELDAQVQQQTAELRASNSELSRAYDELKHTQAQLVQSEKMASLGQLVAGVAHELNNPASFVHGGLANLTEYLGRFLELLQAYEAAPIADAAAAAAIDATRNRVQLDYLLRETPALLRICSEGSDRIKQIVDDLRLFVRADQGQRSRTDVGEGIDNTLRLLGDRLARNRVTVHKAYADPCIVVAEAGQLNQVWMNLLSNAIDAVEGVPAPRIDITVRAADNGHAPAGQPAFAVEIRDNGPGIDPNVLPHIFEPFFTTKPIGRGTGLGLAIVYGAVKSHGGAIEVESGAGGGTVVRVVLPETY